MEVKINRLDWDSNFFKQEIGSVQIDCFQNSLIPKIEKAKREDGFDIIYLFIQKIEASQIADLATVGAILVDEKVTFSKEISTLEKSLINFESYVGEVTPSLLNLALASGHKSRFIKDQRTNYRFADLYGTWIENSVKRLIADEVLISRHDNDISGFVTLKKNGSTGSIGLIAVHENMRGKGIGKELIIAANNWYVTNNCSEAFVVTQKDNEQACLLYKKTGYMVNNIQFIFHM